MGLCGTKPNYSPNNGVLFADMNYQDAMITTNKYVHKFIPPLPIRLAGDKSERQLLQQFHQLPLTRTSTFTHADT